MFYSQNCTKFVHLNIMKIIPIVATRCQITGLKCIKFDFGWGSAPEPTGGAYSAPQTPGWWGGGWLPLLKNPTTLSALPASHLGHSGLTPSVRASKLFTFISPWLTDIISYTGQFFVFRTRTGLTGHWCLFVSFLFCMFFFFGNVCYID